MSSSSYLALIVPAQQVKAVKNELEHADLLNKRIKITKFGKTAGHGSASVIPTNVLASTKQPFVEMAEATGLEPLQQRFAITAVEVSADAQRTAQQINPLRAAITEAAPLLARYLEAEETTEEDLLALTPSSYAIYPPLLLLPHNILERQLWRTLVTKARHKLTDAGQHASFESSCLAKFLARVAVILSVTHVAVNAPIPTEKDVISAGTDDSSETLTLKTERKDTKAFSSSNVLRSPTRLIGLYGDFGPALSPFPQHIPTTSDFEKALWVGTTQNAIYQTWAPRYTMFSKGNVTEKARLLSLPSVTQLQAHPWTAVDLFAGIGYFAFSFARAGASKVLCWDLNPWSCEGLCRGAALNGWSSVLMVSPSEEISEGMSADKMPSLASDADAKFLVFCQSNDHAATTIVHLRTSVPPIRHVNCGMLPDAGRAWWTAVMCLDWHLGGWLHLHETVRLDRIEARAQAIRQAVAGLVQELEDDFNADQATGSRTIGATSSKSKKTVSLEHVERVKSVGPRMMHVVVDVHISGL